MKEITNIITINTGYSKGKAVDILKKGGYERLFFDFGRNQESFIRNIAQGADPGLAVEMMKELGLVKEPEETQDYRAVKPLFECLPSLEVSVSNMYCYKEDASLILSRDVAVRILLLTAKARVGRIETAEWKEVMRDDIYNGLEAVEGEVQYVADRAGKTNICMGASEELLTSLSGLGFRVKEIVVDPPCKPLDLLGEKIKSEILKGEVVRAEEVESLVEGHVSFVDMILELGYEEAYKTWSRFSSALVASLSLIFSICIKGTAFVEGAGNLFL